MDCAFISTPSLFFSLESAERSRSRVLDYDASLGEGCAEFVHYDFNKPTALPANLHGAFACVVIDPPFITVDCWRLYAQTAALLLHPGGHVIGTTIIENARLLEELLNVRPTAFLPSIPNLPYQYATFASFEAVALARRNEEVSQDPEIFLAAAKPAATPRVEAGHADMPIRGSGQGSYDFEAMIEAELRREGGGAG